MVLFKMKDWKARLKDKKFSIRVPLVLLFLLIGLLPACIYGRIQTSSTEKQLVDSRSVDVQNQCLILSSKMTRAGYMTETVKDPSFDTEIFSMGGSLLWIRITVLLKTPSDRPRGRSPYRKK